MRFYDPEVSEVLRTGPVYACPSGRGIPLFLYLKLDSGEI